jgi:threonine synthase
MNDLKECVSHLVDLQCSNCGKIYSAHVINTFATCDECGTSPLISNYDFEHVTKEDIDFADRSMWRYSKLLPLFDQKNKVSLGEGLTPLISLKNLSSDYDFGPLLMKDESLNPTGSFKARGLSMAVSKAKEFGIRKCIIPTAGNAGGALAAYCAKAEMEAVVVMPEHTPKAFKDECILFGAKLILIQGLISQCAQKVREVNSTGDYYDVSTMKEPYRLEGKKTMGYEIAEQLNWKLPDVILYPAGGGTGLIGIWKAFHEMIELGWIENRLPRIIAVQSKNCQPLVETWAGRQKNSKEYQGMPTVANGLAVPNPFAERLILKILIETGGEPISISEMEIISAQKEIARREGLLIAPEGAALLPALQNLVAENKVSRDENILLLNTGSGYKYL